MRRAVLAVAAALLLLGPTALAFRSGGYYAEPQLIAALVAWGLVLVLAVTQGSPLPRSVPGWLVLGGLALMTAWTAISIAWAPLGGPALQDVQRLVLYTGAVLLALAVLRDARALRAVEPVLAGGATVVISYGLAGRLLPGILHLAHSTSAAGRLEQPITYWNAEGALAAVGLVLSARLAGDATRPVGMRALAAAAVVPLGAGVYTSYSRGAIAVAALGLVTVAALAPSRAQLAASAAALLTAVAAAVTSALFPGVASLDGDLSSRISDGLAALAVLVVLAAIAAALTARHARRTRAVADEPPEWTRRLGPVTAVVAAAVLAGLVIGGLGERPSRAELSAGARPQRLASVATNRYEYWRVALKAFGAQPLRGNGAGSFRVLWLAERRIPEAVRDAHSIEFEMAAELGIVGLLALALLVSGAVSAGRRALLRDRAAAAGPCAAALAWFLHASIDWDWQLPAVSAPALLLAATLVVLSERSDVPAGQPRREPSGSSRLRAARARETVARSPSA
jgi:O-Antigen ligase